MNSSNVAHLFHDAFVQTTQHARAGISSGLVGVDQLSPTLLSLPADLPIIHHAHSQPDSNRFPCRTTDPEIIKDRIQESNPFVSPSFMAAHNWYQAGSSVCAAVMGIQYNDVDYFRVNPNFNEVYDDAYWEETNKDIECIRLHMACNARQRAAAKQGTSYHMYLTREPNCTTIEILSFNSQDSNANDAKHIKHEYFKFQFIRRMYSTKEEIVFGFDWPSSMFLWDGRTVWMTPTALIAANYGVNIMDLRARSLSFERRGFRYLQRGFYMYWEELDWNQLRADVATFERAITFTLSSYCVKAFLRENDELCVQVQSLVFEQRKGELEVGELEEYSSHPTEFINPSNQTMNTFSRLCYIMRDKIKVTDGQLELIEPMTKTPVHPIIKFGPVCVPDSCSALINTGVAECGAYTVSTVGGDPGLRPGTPVHGPGARTGGADMDTVTVVVGARTGGEENYNDADDGGKDSLISYIMNVQPVLPPALYDPVFKTNLLHYYIEDEHPPNSYYIDWVANQLSPFITHCPLEHRERILEELLVLFINLLRFPNKKLTSRDGTVLRGEDGHRDERFYVEPSVWFGKWYIAWDEGTKR